MLYTFIKNPEHKSGITDIIKLFIKLGLTAFGGPAAHIAMMEDEVVTKRKWVTRQHFLDMLGATNLIPGPNSTEMAIHTGYIKAGIPGLLLAGICFITPAVLITGILAYLYSLYGKLPSVEPFFYGIKPAVIDIILNAVYKLGVKDLKNWKLLILAIGVTIANFSGVNEIFSILAGGIIGALLIIITNGNKSLKIFIPFPIAYLLTQGIKPDSNFSFNKLFLVFLKIGAVLFGSGYVLIAYLNGELVNNLHWLTKQELLDAVAIGQFTPGPVLSTATFIGFQIGGIYGALLATLGIFLPSFIYVFIVNPFIPKLRSSKYFSVFLDAINISALAIMFVVAVKLGIQVLINQTAGEALWKVWLIAVICAALLLTNKKINSTYLIIGSAALGYLLYFI